MQNKNEGNDNKIMLGDLNFTIDKIDRDDENKTQRLYRCCSNHALYKSSWIMSLRIYGEGRTQIPLSSPATIGPLPRISIDRVYTDIKLPSKTKIGKYS